MFDIKRTLSCIANNQDAKQRRPPRRQTPWIDWSVCFSFAARCELQQAAVTDDCDLAHHLEFDGIDLGLESRSPCARRRTGAAPSPRCSRLLNTCTMSRIAACEAGGSASWRCINSGRSILRYLASLPKAPDQSATTHSKSSTLTEDTLRLMRIRALSTDFVLHRSSRAISR